MSGHITEGTAGSVEDLRCGLAQYVGVVEPLAQERAGVEPEWRDDEHDSGLVGRGAPRISEAAWTGIGPSIGWGLLAFFGLPILGIALVTLVGIPLGLGVLAMLGLIYALGYAATAWIVGPNDSA